MAKQYIVQFGSGNPSLITGFSPTFTVFKVVPGGGNTTPPGITEIPTSTGMYYFTYSPLSPIAFVIDGGASLIAASRWVVGSLDPVDAVDERISEFGASMNALGSSLMAQGSTSGIVGAAIGSLASSFGTTLTDPTTVFGYLKRIQENLEGNQVFTKTSGVQQIWSRGTTYVLGASTYPGASTQIGNKTLSDSGSIITKS
jgi:hypothetical protein